MYNNQYICLGCEKQEGIFDNYYYFKYMWNNVKKRRHFSAVNKILFSSFIKSASTLAALHMSIARGDWLYLKRIGSNEVLGEFPWTNVKVKFGTSEFRPQKYEYAKYVQRVPWHCLLVPSSYLWRLKVNIIYFQIIPVVLMTSISLCVINLKKFYKL